MSDPKDKVPKRSKAAEQALQVLRETRAKMDPKFLDRMKAKLSPFAGMPTPAPESKKGLENREGLFAAPERAIETPEVKTLRPSSPTLAASVYATRQNAVDKGEDENADAGSKKKQPEMIPVDRQKIARIVMKYMELREEKKPGH